jgi:hypothetical protein
MDAMLRRACRIALVIVFAAAAHAGAQGNAVEFNRDVRPILSNHCYVCHGPDSNLRKAKLRLDVEKEAVPRVLVPGKPGESEFYKRLVADDPAERMPPAKANKPLSAQQIAVLKRWIEQGAKYEKHWSLLPPRPGALPAVKDRSWPANPIDDFILARLEKEGMRPAPEADRRTLMRRVYFDLIGLPPSPAEVDAFCADKTPDAYEKVVDKLLTSQHFGERMALYWLDLVRYADTGGYHSDNHRDVTLYRDWVIGAFNRNLPFDQFTVEQLAGDLLPRPTDQQKIASGYNRLLQTTEEGGAQAKEYTAKYAADRVRNLSTVWMGMTLGCCECHDHKYDPFTTREFYQLEAFFADVQERAVGRQDQTPIPTAAQAEQIKQLKAKAEALRGRLKQFSPKPGTPEERGEIEDISKQVAKLEAQQKALTKSLPSTLVTMAGPPRTVRVLPRGNWLDDTGEIVLPDVPASLPALTVKGKKRYDRLDLARWLVAPDNPLTARVFMNRLWMLYFGQGLAKTLDDLGAQGAWPTHPELLDWLAVDFRARGWNVKRAIKQIVMSRTYRQASKADAALAGRDPYNQLLARQGRFRLDAELIRDNALAISGLLAFRTGGPSVKPYQPAGYWAFLNFPTRAWANDKGDNQYRRGLNTYWQRTFLHPSLLAFDAPTREECTVERARSNTPQQALVLLNDPTYVEAARVFAERVVRKGGADAPARIGYAFREALQRAPSAAEAKVLGDLLEHHRKHYQQSPAAAQALLKVGQRPAPTDLPAAELAAWASVTRAILNLHETITRN